MNKKAKIIVLTFLVILTVVLAFLSSDPIVSCKADVPAIYLEAVEGQVKGLYSDKMPLAPFLVTVDSFSDETAFYTIHYFPFGTVEMSYNEEEGYNIEKPLTRLS